MNPVIQTLSDALDHHRAGRLAAAEELYREVLARDPDNADALHLVGMLAYDAGRYREALAHIARAIQLNGGVAPFHNNLGNVFHALGRPYEACLCFAQALTLAPDYVEAHINFGNSLQAHGLLEEAVAHYGRALQLRPDSPEAHNNLGNALLAQGKREQAATSFRQALCLKPDYAEACVNLSAALKSLERLEEAADCCRQAIRLAPNMAEAYSNLGTMLACLERFEHAEAAAREALARKPDLAEPFVILAVIRQAQNRFGEAEACARRALVLRPGYAEAHNNLGNALQEQGHLEEAERSYRAALELKPDLADAHYNLGNALRRMRRLAEACASYDQAIRLKPRYVKAHWNRSLILLLAGDLERGWEEFEWRWKKPDTPERSFPQPVWDGSALENRTILLYAEQGLGDTIQFVRYAELAKQAGATVILECSPKLAPLLGSARGIDRLVAAGSPLPDFDVHAALLSLPRLFHTTRASIPARVPYIGIEAGFRRKWQSRLGPVRGRKVGLIWAGNPQHAEDRLRSLSLEAFAPLADVPGSVWFSLQYGDSAGQAASPPAGLNLFDLSAETQDFRDAAAAMEQLDLVISVDTSMAHLAGALARPVWVLLPFVPDWRWWLDREDTPWYPTMRLFRQPRPGDWAPVVSAVREALEHGNPG